MNRNGCCFWIIATFVAFIYCQLPMVQGIDCTKNEDCPSTGSNTLIAVCYNKMCYYSTGVCVMNLCPQGTCVKDASGADVCITGLQTTTVSTSTTTSSTTTAACSDKVGPNGVSNCAQVAYLCNNGLYYNLMTQQCPKTCGRCGAATIAPAPKTTCVDKVDANGVSNCAQVAYLCNNALYRSLLIQQCPKTCGFCNTAGTGTGCVDRVGANGVSNCASVAYLCNSPLYYNLMTQQCPKTCGRCT